MKKILILLMLASCGNDKIVTEDHNGDTHEYTIRNGKKTHDDCRFCETQNPEGNP